MATLDWYGCATFRLRLRGLTVFLDGYIDRAPHAAGAGRTAADVDECDWILVGHSHFDHLSGAEVIMANTGATLVGSYETVRVMERAGVPLERMLVVSGGERVDLGDDVVATVLPGLHSCVWSHHQMAQADTECLGDLGLSLQEQQRRMAELTQYMATSLDPRSLEHLLGSMVGHSERGDGGALLYLIESPEGSILYQDTSGHWSGIIDGVRPDVAILAAAGRANVDGQPIQGTLAAFVQRQVEVLRPRTVVLCHHDDWLPGFSIATDMAPLRRAVEAAGVGATLVELGYVDGHEILTP